MERVDGACGLQLFQGRRTSVANNWWGCHATDAWNQTVMGTADSHWTSPVAGPVDSHGFGPRQNQQVQQLVPAMAGYPMVLGQVELG